MLDGYIKLHRKMLKWEWFECSETLHIFLYLLMSAAYEKHNWRGITLEPGQLVTGIRAISAATCISVRAVRTAMTRLKTTHEITQQTTHKGSLITIVNWAQYQASAEKNDTPNDTPNDKRATHQRHSNDTPATHTEEYIEREERQERKEKTVKHRHGEYNNVLLTDGDLEKLKSEYPSEWQALIERLSEYMESKGATYKNHLATMRNWMRRDKERKPNKGIPCNASDYKEEMW